MIKAENYEADFLAGFDLDEMNALEDGDLSLFNTLDNAPSYGLSDSFSGPSEFIPPPDGAFADQKSTFKPAPIDESVGSDHDGIQPPERPQKTAPAMPIQKLEEPPMGLQEEDESELHEELLQQQQQPLQPSRTAETPEPGLFPAALHLHNGQVLPPGIDPNEPMLPPLVIDPMEVGKISVILQKNQCCECKACGKLFKSIWYLKQHSVRHSNERPFRCNFCGKQFKFRSNLYQHRCPGRTRHMDGSLCKCPDKNLCPHKAAQGERGGRQNSKRFYTRGIAYTELPISTESAKNNAEDSSSSRDNYNSELNSSADAYEPNGASEKSGLDQSAAFGFAQDMVNFNGPMDHSASYDDNAGPDGTVQDAPSDGAPLADENCVREKPFDPEYIEAYIQKNRHRLHQCRKCKLYFPSREYLSRHLAYHDSIDAHPYACEYCAQRFAAERQLLNHQMLHSEDSPHKCRACHGMFRSAIALRRHKDQSRQCYVPPFGIQPKLVVSPTAPLDQYAFIESEDEEEPDHATVKLSIEDPLRHHATGLVHQKSLADSGVGSGSSTHSTSPPQSFDDDAMELHEEKEKRSKDDETDSGFRSRLNSSIHSCSPGSSSTFSADGGSPSRKFSNAGTMPTDTMYASTSGIFPSMTSTSHYSAYHMHTRSHGSHMPATSAVNYSSLSMAPVVTGAESDVRDQLARSSREAMRIGGFSLAEDADVSTLIAGSSVHSVEAHNVLLSGKEAACVALPEGLCPDDGDLRSAFDVADPSELVLEAIRELIWRMTAVVLGECVKKSRSVHEKQLLSQDNVAAVAAIVEADGGVEGAQASSSPGGKNATSKANSELH